MQFVKEAQSKRLLTGPQKLDGCWEVIEQNCGQQFACALFKKIVASNLSASNDKDRRVNDQLGQMVLSFMYRHNAVADLWTAFGKLCKTMKKTKAQTSHSSL